jgi:hypothetical protein
MASSGDRDKKHNGKVVSKTTEYVALALTALVVLYVLLIPFGFIGKENRYGLPEIILVITLVVLFSGVLGRLTEITVEPGKLNARLNYVEEKTDKLGEEQSKLEGQIEALRLALRGVVNVFELDKLKGLAAQGPFTVQYHPRMYEELRELDAKKFIEPLEGRGIIDIKKDNEWHRNEFNLKTYVRLRQEGKEYLELLDKV